MLAQHCWETTFLGQSGPKRAKSSQTVQYNLEVKNLASQHCPQNYFCNLFDIPDNCRRRRQCKFFWQV